ncbi:MAG: T9SS type A sorting domain-containing protein [bacterium]
MIKFFLIVLFYSWCLIAQNHIKFIDDVPNAFKIKYNEENPCFNPLHVGDIWQYEVSEGMFQVNWVEKDTSVNNKKYFKKIFLYDPWDGDRYINWERNDSLLISSYKLDNEDLDSDGIYDEELLMDSLNLPIFSDYLSYRYSNIERNRYEPINVSIKDTGWVIIWGDTVKTKMLEYQAESSIYFYNEVCDKFGIFARWCEGPANWLTGAIIKGIQYGNIVNRIEEGKNLPCSWVLNQNYPNPFNSSTIIRVIIAGRDNFTIKVYDTLGREVKTIFEGELNIGERYLKWDGTDNNNNALSSGVYFCRMSSSDKIQTKKMILLR